MLFRDDDVSKWTDLTTFMAIHDLFKKYKKVHTIAVEMEGLWESRGIWHLIATEPYISVGLHGWQHVDYSTLSYEECSDHIKKSLQYWRKHIQDGYCKHIPIVTFFPPWNRANDNLRRACADWGMKIDNRANDPNVFAFHWWEFIGGNGLDRLEGALKRVA